MLSYEEARQKVIEVARSHFHPPPPETIDISSEPASALGRILAEEIIADRNYPPFDRSIRDGYAVRASDAINVPARLKLIGESKAGSGFEGVIGPSQCVQIMTGAPVPAGADAVVMIEYTKAEGEVVSIERAARVGDHIVSTGSEAGMKEVVLLRGKRLGYAELAMAARVGHVKLRVYPKPRVAILSTGDEVVPAQATPGPHQIRNSNSISLAAQIALAGAEPVLLGNSRDDVQELRARIEQGLQADMLVLSGGVSMGKYDLVEGVLKEIGAEFYFDAVAIRPGRPAVFGTCEDKLVFGLPGNPVSTMVTFEILAVPAVDVLSGGSVRPLPLFKAKLTHDLREKPGLAHFLPARVEFRDGNASVETVYWQGSGDVVALVNANCFVVVGADREEISAGEWVDVLPRRGTI
ncbi:MAG: gephyrin-like molybdotransferase Glp [Candidatus Acidiferrales bacterium]